MINPGLEKCKANVSSNFAPVHVINEQQMYIFTHWNLHTRENWVVCSFTYTGTHWMGSWIGPKTGRNFREVNYPLFTPEFELWIIQPSVQSLYNYTGGLVGP
jgi:hypothetical protein